MFLSLFYFLFISLPEDTEELGKNQTTTPLAKPQAQTPHKLILKGRGNNTSTSTFQKIPSPNVLYIAGLPKPFKNLQFSIETKKI